MKPTTGQDRYMDSTSVSLLFAAPHTPSPEEPLLAAHRFFLDNTELQPGIYRHASLVYRGVSGKFAREYPSQPPTAYPLFSAHHSNCPEASNFANVTPRLRPTPRPNRQPMPALLTTNPYSNPWRRAPLRLLRSIGALDTILRRVS